MYRKGLASLPNVETLSPLVTRILGQNPGPKTLQGTNTYLVGRPPNVTLIDTGEANNSNYLEILSSTLLRLQLTITSIIITHIHPDHMGGCPGVLDMLSSYRHDGENIPVYKIPHELDTQFVARDKITPLHDNQQLVPTPGGVTLTVLHTPGHTPDSLSLYLEEEDALFSGDTILGGSSADFASYSDYIASLLRIRGLGPGTVYPGHGIVEAGDVVDRYISHRQHRERGVLECLRGCGGEGVVSVEQLTDRVYERENLQDPALIASARRIVSLILDKLEVDGTAIVDGDGKWTAV